MPRFSPIIAAATLLVGGISAVMSGTAYAQTAPAAATLTVGSPAPKLPVAEWVKGTPVKLGDGKVHVVEFWATWCGPCKMTIPHLTELSKKYAGKADFTGVSVWERGEGIPAKVKDFVKTMGAQMDYHVARDDEKGTIAKTWMQAANQNGIPTAFIVDKKGTVVWIGHPMDNLDETLGKVIDGKYDVTTAKAEFAKKQAEVAAEEAKNAELQKLFTPALQLAQQKKYTEAVAEMDKVLEANPQHTVSVLPLKFSLMMQYDEAAAQKFVAKAATTPGVNPQTLNQIAWSIVEPESKIKTPDYAAAVTIAEAAVAATKEQDAATLDTLSYAYEKNGNLDKAVATEEKAVALLKNDTSDMAKEIKARLVDLKTKQKPQ